MDIEKIVRIIDMRDSEPSLWDVLFGTPKKRAKKRNQTSLMTIGKRDVLNVMSITKIANVRIALTMTAEIREVEDKR